MDLRRPFSNKSMRFGSCGAVVLLASFLCCNPLVQSNAGDISVQQDRPRKVILANSSIAKRKPPAISDPIPLLDNSVPSFGDQNPNPLNVGNDPIPLPIRIAPTSIYANRTLPNREQWIESYGGTQRSEGAVHDGLDWLKRHQATDGSWAPMCLGHGPESRCNKMRPCQDAGQVFAYAQTGLALLAFQAGGHFHFNKTKYSENVRRGLNWIVEHQNHDGQLFLRPSHQYMYEHGIATFALAEACALEVAAERPRDIRYRQALEKAVTYLLSQQHDDGGWRYDGYPESFSDVSVSGWQMLALKSALVAGVKIPQDRLNQLAEFIHGCRMDDRGRTSYVMSVEQVSEATTGVGMLLHQILLKTPRSQLVNEAAPYLADYAEQNWKPGQLGRDDYYLWYNCTLAMFQAGGAPWERWNTVVRSRLMSLRVKEGCGQGSWAPFTTYDSVGGRIYTTALAVLTLEVYYRFSKPPEKSYYSQ